MELCNLGELKLIERIKNIVRHRQPDVAVGIGDDACVLRDGSVLTTDSFAEGVHFDLRYMGFYDVGIRAACATLSDLAAMGAEPKLLLVSLFLRPDREVAGLVQLYRGMETIARRFSVDIAGGDVVSSRNFALTLTALGKTRKPVLRSTARPGDLLYLTGYPGLAEAGRLALTHRLDRRRFPGAIARHLAPLPRIREARRLKQSLTAMIDTSDGLSTDANHLAVESRVRIDIFKSSLPVHPEVMEISRRLSVPLDNLLLHSGEDFELLFTGPEKIPGSPVTQIGIVKRGQGVNLVGNKKTARLRPGGYEHLTS